MIKILKKETNEVLFEAKKCKTVKEALEVACALGIDLSGADLERVTVTFANLQGIKLSGASLRGADLHDTDFTGGDLSFANLGSTNLTKGVLKGCNLFKVNLERANLTGTCMRDVTGWPEWREAKTQG